jgi:hypothetical protein
MCERQVPGDFPCVDLLSNLYDTKCMRFHFTFERVLLLLLVLLVLLNIFHVPALNFADVTLLYLGGRAITLFTIIFLGVLLWLFKYLNSPFREIVGIILFFWILSFFLGAFLGGLANIFLLLIVVFIFFQFFSIF